MSNDPSIRKPKDLTTVDINNMGELLWWSHHLAVTPEKLLSIIQQTGNSANNIKNHLTEEKSSDHSE